MEENVGETRITHLANDKVLCADNIIDLEKMFRRDTNDKNKWTHVRKCTTIYLSGKIDRVGKGQQRCRH